jgi:hypothetical protein
MEDCREWTNEQIAGKFLLNQYCAISGKKPSMLRRTEMSEAIRFIQVVMCEVGIPYSEESIIAARSAAKRKKRPHRRRR